MGTTHKGNCPRPLWRNHFVLAIAMKGHPVIISSKLFLKFCPRFQRTLRFGGHIFWRFFFCYFCRGLNSGHWFQGRKCLMFLTYVQKSNWPSPLAVMKFVSFIFVVSFREMDLPNIILTSYVFVWFVAAAICMVKAGQSVHLATLFFSCASLDKRLTWLTTMLTSTSCTYFPCNWQQPFLNESAEGRGMTVENISWSISKNVSLVRDRAWI